MTLYPESAVHRPPWPSAWPGPVTIRHVAGAVFMVGLTLGFGIGAVLLTRSGDPRGPLIGFCVPFIAAATVVVVVRDLRGRRHQPSSITLTEVPTLLRTAVVIRYSSVRAWAFLVLGVTLVLPMAGYCAVLIAAGLAEFPRYWGAALPVLVIGPLTVYLLLCLAHIAMGRMRRGLLALTPEGIYHRAWAYEAYVPWESVIGVWPWHGGQPARPQVSTSVLPDPGVWFRRTSGLWRQPEFTLQPHIVLPCVEFPVDPALLLHALQHYAEHPTHRAELGDDRGVQRIRTGSFPSSN